jgi:hypothetical protein
MYIQGVSTRKVTKITEELCGLEVTSMDVSRATKLLDKEVEACATGGSEQSDILFWMPATRKSVMVVASLIVPFWSPWESMKMASAPFLAQVSPCQRLKFTGERLFLPS